jgi:hypothetical protein
MEILPNSRVSIGTIARPMPAAGGAGCPNYFRKPS